MQDKHPVKQVQFADEVFYTRKKLIMEDNNKSKICNIDGKSFYPFSSRIWIGNSAAPDSSQMTQLVSMMPSQSMSLLRLQMGEGNNKG